MPGTASSIKEGSRYGELILDSFFSRDETATILDNSLSNRPIMNVDGLAVHQAKIPLTYDTIFAPLNQFQVSNYTYRNATGGVHPHFNTVGTIGTMTNTLANGSPNMLTIQNYISQSVTTSVQNAYPAGTLPVTTTPHAATAGVFYVASDVPDGSSYGGFQPLHLVYFTFGLNSSATGFVVYIIVLSAPGLTPGDLRGSVTLSYPTYLGRKFGLPDVGSLTIDLSQYTPISFSGVADPSATAPFVSVTGSVNGSGQATLGYYVLPFPFNAEMNMGRSLILRGSLATDTQSMVFMNNEESQNSDILAALPIYGAYGDIVQYNSPNYEIFKLARPIQIRHVRVWFTRAEDPTQVPVEFKGVDYWLKLALSITDEYQTDTLQDDKNPSNYYQSTGAKRIKIS